MFKINFHGLICATLLVQLEPAFISAAPLSAPVLASIYNNELYYLQLSRMDGPLGYYEFVVQPLGRTAENSHPKPKYEFLLNSDDVAAQLPVRWRIRDDILWMLGSGVLINPVVVERIPLAELPQFDANNPKAREILESKYGESGLNISRYFGWDLGFALRDFERMVRNKTPMLGKYKTADEWHFAMWTKYAFCDSLPTSPSSESTFFLYKGKCEVWDTVRTWPKNFDPNKDTQWNMRWHDHPQEKFDVGFCEPFTVFYKKYVYFFATKSGKLVTVKKSAIFGKWDVVKAWADEDRPITAIITDTATDRSFAFTEAKKTKDGAQAKEVYFEFDDKITPVEFDRSKIELMKGEAPLPMLRQLTQVLINDKKLQIGKK